MQAWMIDFAFAPSQQQIMLIQCFSLLILGAALATLATVNFAQALFVGLFAGPLSFVRPLRLSSSLPSPARISLAILAVLAMLAISPLPLLYASSHLFKRSFHSMLVEAAWAWKVEQVWTSLTIWVIWWPAWVCGTIVLLNGLLPKRQPSGVKTK